MGVVAWHRKAVHAHQGLQELIAKVLDLQGVATGHEVGSERNSLVNLPLIDLQAGPSQGERCQQALCRSTPSSQARGAPSGATLVRYAGS